MISMEFLGGKVSENSGSVYVTYLKEPLADRARPGTLQVQLVYLVGQALHETLK